MAPAKSCRAVVRDSAVLTSATRGRGCHGRGRGCHGRRCERIAFRRQPSEVVDVQQTVSATRRRIFTACGNQWPKIGTGAYALLSSYIAPTAVCQMGIPARRKASILCTRFPYDKRSTCRFAFRPSRRMLSNRPSLPRARRHGQRVQIPAERARMLSRGRHPLGELAGAQPIATDAARARQGAAAPSCEFAPPSRASGEAIRRSIECLPTHKAIDGARRCPSRPFVLRFPACSASLGFSFPSTRSPFVSRSAIVPTRSSKAQAVTPATSQC
jgi:hypothetical protein